MSLSQKSYRVVGLIQRKDPFFEEDGKFYLDEIFYGEPCLQGFYVNADSPDSAIEAFTLHWGKDHFIRKVTLVIEESVDKHMDALNEIKDYLEESDSLEDDDSDDNYDNFLNGFS